MPSRLLVGLLLAAVAPLAARGADDHPLKNAKVGDFVTYKVSVNFGGMDLSGTSTQTVTAKSDKEVTVKTAGKMNDMDFPESEQKIDLTKPFDPTKMAAPPGSEAKFEKLKDGTEKLKVGDKTYDTTWTTYKMTASGMGQDITGEVKVWMAKDVPFGVAKTETKVSFGGMDIKAEMTFSESGTAKKDK